MRIKLLNDRLGKKAGAEWNHPMASVARKLIEDGDALAVEECDLHFNPTAEAGEEHDEADDTDLHEEGKPVTEKKPKGKAKKPKAKK